MLNRGDDDPHGDPLVPPKDEGKPIAIPLPIPPPLLHFQDTPALRQGYIPVDLASVYQSAQERYMKYGALYPLDVVRFVDMDRRSYRRPPLPQVGTGSVQRLPRRRRRRRRHRRKPSPSSSSSSSSSDSSSSGSVAELSPPLLSSPPEPIETEGGADDLIRDFQVEVTQEVISSFQSQPPGPEPIPSIDAGQATEEEEEDEQVEEELPRLETAVDVGAELPTTETTDVDALQILDSSDDECVIVATRRGQPRLDLSGPGSTPNAPITLESEDDAEDETSDPSWSLPNGEDEEDESETQESGPVATRRMSTSLSGRKVCRIPLRGATLKVKYDLAQKMCDSLRFAYYIGSRFTMRFKESEIVELRSVRVVATLNCVETPSNPLPRFSGKIVSPETESRPFTRLSPSELGAQLCVHVGLPSPRRQRKNPTLAIVEELIEAAGHKLSRHRTKYSRRARKRSRSQARDERPKKKRRLNPPPPEDGRE